MSNVPTELNASHEWVLNEGDGVYCVGSTEHAQELLGDMVFMDLPEIGTSFFPGEDIAVRCVILANLAAALAAGAG